MCQSVPDPHTDDERQCQGCAHSVACDVLYGALYGAPYGVLAVIVLWVLGV